jgi:hypothetical protein
VLAAQAARISVVEALLEHAGIPCAVEAETVSALDACVQVVAPPQAVTTSTVASHFLFAAKHFMQMFVYVRVSGCYKEVAFAQPANGKQISR